MASFPKKYSSEIEFFPSRIKEILREEVAFLGGKIIACNTVGLDMGLQSRTAKYGLRACHTRTEVGPRGLIALLLSNGNEGVAVMANSKAV